MKLSALAAAAQADALAYLAQGGALRLLESGRVIATLPFTDMNTDGNVVTGEFTGVADSYGIANWYIVLDATGSALVEGDIADLHIDVPRILIHASVAGTWTHTVPR